MKKLIALLLTAAMIFALCACSDEDVPAITATETPAPTDTPVPTPTPEPDTQLASVIVPEAHALWSLLQRGDIVEVWGEYQDYFVVQFKGQLGLIEKRLLRADGEHDPESYTAYAGVNAVCFPDYRMRAADGKELNVNTALTVIDELGDCVIAELEGEMVYIPASQISLSKYYADWGGGGGGGGSADGGDISLGFALKPGVSIRKLSTFVEKPKKLQGNAKVLADNTEFIMAIYELDETVQVLKADQPYCQLLVKGERALMERRYLLMEGDKPYEPWTGYAAGNVKIYPGESTVDEPTAALQRNDEITVLQVVDRWYVVRSGDAVGFMLREDVSETQVQIYDWGGGGGGGAEWTEPAL